MSEIWAHRGSSHIYIENTLAAFKQAIKEGVDRIELDVQRTADGQLVVIHDENLLRLTGKNLFVWEINWSALQELTLNSKLNQNSKADAFHAKVPRLEEVLQLIKNSNVSVNIELKNSLYFYPGMEEEVIACVNKLHMRGRVIYSSFNHLSMKKMVALVGGENCGVLTMDIQNDPWHYTKKIGASAYHPMISSLQHLNLVEKCHQANLKVHVWTADEDLYIYGALLLGVDAIITNKPTKALQLRQQFYDDEGKQALKSVQAAGLKIIERGERDV